MYCTFAGTSKPAHFEGFTDSLSSLESSVHWHSSIPLAQEGTISHPFPQCSFAFRSLGIQSCIPSAGGLFSKEFRLKYIRYNLGNYPRETRSHSIFSVLPFSWYLIAHDLCLLQSACKFLSSASPSNIFKHYTYL